MILYFIIAIFTTRYLKKSLQTRVLLPAWDKIFTVIFFASIALLVLSIFFKTAGPVLKWVAHAPLLFLLYVLYVKEEFRTARSYMLAIFPYVFISLAADVVKLFYTRFGNYIDTAIFFSLVWLVAMLIINRRQQKALLKEKLKTKEEEEQNKIMAKRKAELEVQVAERTAEIMFQKEELQEALNELKATQTQLIHSEKMASLGELTAGIAHEIQNPLNFVNNFSEVNKELLVEMRDEIEKGHFDEVKSLASDIIDNEEKINHHGKRADAIVKGMLQHSRSSSGIKEPTDINALTDEYLRLAYHGLRAKDNSFNATMKTDYDETLSAGEKGIGNINIVPQDIGRVILNLITNAFYAVQERQKVEGLGYEPIVFVSTGRVGRMVEISVKDNGNGIPQKIMAKIFQPFFTTKPTGQGTGLGLSLSYDIVKAHGGEMKVETKEGEGSEFIIVLPLL